MTKLYKTAWCPNWILKLLTPHTWTDLSPYDPATDAILKQVMRRGRLEQLGSYTAVVEVGAGKFHIWIANFPYSYGKRRAGMYDRGGLPSVRTRYLFRDWLIEQELAQLDLPADDV